MLTSIDLFTGIGGFTLALTDIARPIMYCDNDPKVIGLLQKNIDRDCIPRAPIVTDVNDIDAVKACVGHQKVDIITAGFPCIGFSKRGKRGGFHNSASSLFRPASVIIEHFKPGIVFFENVAEILSANQGDDIREIWSVMSRLGYSMRWTVRSASDVGALHFRKRWFCLCVRGLPGDITASKAWEFGKRPPKLIAPKAADASRRLEMLGNAIVPMCARLAFFSLFTGFKIMTIQDLGDDNQLITYSKELMSYRVSKWSASKFPKHVQAAAKGILECRETIPTRLPDVHIVVDPNHFSTTHAYTQNPMRPKRSPLLSSPVVIKAWPTPRTTSTTHSHNLSERTVQDLSTAAMYASCVNGKKQPKTRDGQRLSPKYVEWLMGYPLNFTKG